MSGNKQHRIVSLHPALSELIELFGLAEQLVAGARGDEGRKIPIVTTPFSDRDRDTGHNGSGQNRKILADFLCQDVVDIPQLAELSPSIVCTIVPAEVDLGAAASSVTNAVIAHIDDIRAQLRGACANDNLKLLAFDPRRFEQITEMIIDLGRGLGVAALGRDRAQRLKAQALDWARNFYDRMKNKRVIVLSSIAPLMSAGLWIPDLITLASAHSFESNPGQDDREVSWAEIEAFRPDVIIVAPRGGTLNGAAAMLKPLEAIPAWERLPAVKRGEVIFAPGYSLYQPGYGLVSGIALLYSAIAGFESGYITERDSFYRLRYLELQRHRFVTK